jgi:hypothetical protein
MVFNAELRNIHMLTTVHRAQQKEDLKSEMQSTGRELLNNSMCWNTIRKKGLLAT